MSVDDTTRLSEVDPALVRLAEAILFVAGEPVPCDRLAAALRIGSTGLVAVLAAIDHALADRGLRLQRHGQTVQLVTAPDLARGIERFLGMPAVHRLSHAALETLAVIAYRQPVTRAQVEAVRGVDSSGVLGTLLARGLIEEVGRLPGPGHPTQFGTTAAFLRVFGLASLDDLPALVADDGSTLSDAWNRRLAGHAAGPRQAEADL